MMKLVFIYGPPAVGKLTVARQLAKISDYKLFHNHLTLDLAESVFEWGTPDFWKLVRSLRLEVISATAKISESGLIFTFVYNGTKSEDLFIEKIVKCVEKEKGKVYFIQLLASREILKKRVLNPSRKKFSKIKTLSSLKNALEVNKENKPIKKTPHFVIDNSKGSAKNIALQIKNFVKIIP